MIPKTIGRYQIQKALPPGGMGQVYIAYDPDSERLVVVKVLPAELSQDPSFRARFQREAQIVADLEHPNIVPVYDFGEESGQPYLVMRLMMGGSLADRLRSGPLGLAEAARIISAFASTLDAVHESNLIHRDLKPGNILFDNEDNPYLADFGIVKIREAGATLTGENIVGTPAYMSPEQGRGESHLDGRSDIYSLGVVLFEMLSGRLPYEADTPMAQILKHINTPIPNILDIRPDLPPDVQAIIARSMSKAKATRYQTADELAEALNAVVAGEPLPALRAATLPETGDEQVRSEQVTPQPGERGIFVGTTTGPEGGARRLLRIALRILRVLALTTLGTVVVLLVGLLTPIKLPGEEAFRVLVGLDTPTATATAEPTLTATVTPQPSSTPAPQDTPTLAPTSPPTSTPTRVPTATPTLILPVANSVLIPTPGAPISIANFDQLTKLAALNQGLFLDITWSPDGSLLAIGTTTGVDLYDAQTLEWSKSIPAQNPAVGIDFSPDGRLVAAAEQSSVAVWDWENLVPVFDLAGSGELIDHVEFSGDGTALLGGGVNTYVWSAADGSLAYLLEGVDPLNVGISHDGQYLAVPMEARVVRVLNTRDGSEIIQLQAFGVQEVEFTENGAMLVAFCGDTIRLWDTRNADPVQWVEIAALAGIDADISDDGNTIATVRRNGGVEVYRFGTSGRPDVPQEFYKYDTNGAIGIQLSPLGTYVAFWYERQTGYQSPSDRYAIYVRRVVDGERMADFRTDLVWTGEVSFSPDELRLASLSDHEQVQLWDINIASLITSLERVSGVSNLSYDIADRNLSSLDQEVTSANGEITARVAGENVDLFYVKDGSMIRTMYANLAATADLALTYDGQVLATVSARDTVRVWSVGDGGQICVIGGTGAIAQFTDVTNLFFSEDGSRLATYQDLPQGQVLSYWDASNCDQLASYWLPNDMISLDKSIFAEGQGVWEGRLGDIHFRKVDDGSLLLTLYGSFQDEVMVRYDETINLFRYAHFSEDGLYFWLGNEDGTLHVWGIQP